MKWKNRKEHRIAGYMKQRLGKWCNFWDDKLQGGGDCNRVEAKVIRDEGVLYPLLSNILFLLYYCAYRTLRKKCRIIAVVMNVCLIPDFNGAAFIINYGAIIADSLYHVKKISCYL